MLCQATREGLVINKARGHEEYIKSQSLTTFQTAACCSHESHAVSQHICCAAYAEQSHDLLMAGCLPMQVWAPGRLRRHVLRLPVCDGAGSGHVAAALCCRPTQPDSRCAPRSICLQTAQYRSLQAIARTVDIEACRDGR